MLTELARPLPDGFVGDDDAAGRQQFLNHVKPERETEIQPNGMADDLGRECALYPPASLCKSQPAA